VLTGVLKNKRQPHAGWRQEVMGGNFTQAKRIFPLPHGKNLFPLREVHSQLGNSLA
jgi:hypothetical protein